MKKTKRKGFNFFRSYYDVFNELKTKKDKLAFIEALLDKQFLGIDPEKLEGMAKFAWISQVNSIDNQVKGYEDKTGIKLTPTEGGINTPTEQEKEKVKVEVQVKGGVNDKVIERDKSARLFFKTKTDFLKWFSEVREKETGLPSNFNTLYPEQQTDLFTLKKSYTFEDFNKALKNLCQDEWAKENNQIVPKHFLNLDNFSKYLNAKSKNNEGETLQERAARKMKEEMNR